MAQAPSSHTATSPEANPGGRSASRRQLLAQWVLLPLLWVAVIFVSVAQSQATRDTEFEVALAFAVLEWGPWVLLSPVVVWIARRIQIDGRNWLKTVPLHALAAVAVAGLTVELGDLAVSSGVVTLPERGGPSRGAETSRPQGAEERSAIPRSSNDRGPQRGPPRFIRARISIPIYCVLVAGVHAFIYHRRSLERERRALTAEARLVEARLIALQTQLNPHFLFNTLNAISGLVYTDQRAADEMLCGLSGLLRRVLEISEQKEVRLKDELELIDRYLDIQLIRFSDRLRVSRDVPEALAGAMVPTLILQPLVENALVHGIGPHATGGILTIRAVRSEHRLVLTISDQAHQPADGVRKQAGKEGTGLSNTRARLAALYGNEANFRLEPGAQGGTAAVIELPLRMDSAS